MRIPKHAALCMWQVLAAYNIDLAIQRQTPSTGMLQSHSAWLQNSIQEVACLLRPHALVQVHQLPVDCLVCPGVVKDQ